MCLVNESSTDCLVWDIFTNIQSKFEYFLNREDQERVCPMPQTLDVTTEIPCSHEHCLHVSNTFQCLFCCDYCMCMIIWRQYSLLGESQYSTTHMVDSRPSVVGGPFCPNHSTAARRREGFDLLGQTKQGVHRVTIVTRLWCCDCR